jgi:hypothetical protein
MILSNPRRSAADLQITPVTQLVGQSLPCHWRSGGPIELAHDSFGFPTKERKSCCCRSTAWGENLVAGLAELGEVWCD